MSPAPPSTVPTVARRADLVRIVTYVSECDVRAITPPIDYDLAVEILRCTTTDLSTLDIVCEGTGRFCSWVA